VCATEEQSPPARKIFAAAAGCSPLTRSTGAAAREPNAPAGTATASPNLPSASRLGTRPAGSICARARAGSVRSAAAVGSGSPTDAAGGVAGPR